MKHSAQQQKGIKSCLLQQNRGTFVLLTTCLSKLLHKIIEKRVLPPVTGGGRHSSSPGRAPLLSHLGCYAALPSDAELMPGAASLCLGRSHKRTDHYESTVVSEAVLRASRVLYWRNTVSRKGEERKELNNLLQET